MLTEAHILGLLNGTLPPEERERVARELARDPEAARRVFGAERLDALAVLLRADTPAAPPASPSPPAEKPMPRPELSADEALRQALQQAGKGGWAYRPESDPAAPGVLAALGGATREWSRTWHARLLLLGLALGLALLAFALLKTGHLLPAGSLGSGVVTNPPPAAPAPAPGSRTGPL